MALEPQQLKNILFEEFPGRTRQIETLLNWFGTPKEKTPPTIFIHGNRALGKTELIKRLFKLGFTSRQFSFLDCRVCYSIEDLFEIILNDLTGEQLSCKSINDFVMNLQEICEIGSETRYMIFDNADVLWDLFSTLTPALLTLPQWIGLNVCGIFISQAPWEKFRMAVGIPEPWQLYFPEYTRDELIQILMKSCPDDEDPCFYKAFVENICNSFYENCDLIDFFRLLPDLFDKFVEPIQEERATRNDISLLCNELKSYFNETLDKLYLQDISAANFEDQLPQWSLYLLIATFLGSYIPQNLDQRYFATKACEKPRLPRVPKKQKLSHDSPAKLPQQLKGPQSFELERVLAIFQSIYYNHRNIQTIDIHQQIESFVAHHLVVCTVPYDRLGSREYRCNVSYHCVKQVSRDIGFDLSKYLDEFDYN
ncbi:origin recognition complex subunit 5 C-terminus-domain-containing protein [Gigaspora rosea]|uniref:Origin recognition complex subunit 5 C-terminus-domain-containing protein n=1 Tax=Gigaspora rosea TaxID=44941 RepID=A0A397V6A2_9GLOM|nr:origin recognition complex subunit 5 C-terminus-domain-containing protein [Gigaspora rosea]